MKLKDLITSNHWLSVELTLIELYPDQQKNIDAYQNVFEKLQFLQDSESDMNIVLTECFEDDGENDYVEVCGKKNNDSEDTVSYAIEFRPWAEWLGMTIDELTLKNFNELEIISHCLFEMTFMGYDEQTITKEMSELEKRIGDFEKMTPEERKKNTISWEELKKQLDIDTENTEEEIE